MKDYLKKEERLDLLFFKKYIDSLENTIKDWGGRNNLTKDESKALKTALTWGCKAFDSIVKRQSQQTLKTFWNSIKDSAVVVHDRYAVKQYKQKMSTEMMDAYELNKDYYKLVEEIIFANCKNCTKDHKNCGFAEVFEERCIPEPTGYDCGNCRYSYTELNLGENKGA